MRFALKVIRRAFLSALSLAAVVSCFLILAAYAPLPDIRYEDSDGLTACGTRTGAFFVRATTPKHRIWVYLVAVEGQLTGGGHLLIEKTSPCRFELGGARLKLLFELEPSIDPRALAHRTRAPSNPDGFKASVIFVTPAWLPAPLFAAYPLWAFVRGPWRRRRRKAKGLCIRCGYDLTGNVTGICSECGTKVEPR